MFRILSSIALSIVHLALARSFPGKPKRQTLGFHDENRIGCEFVPRTQHKPDEFG